MTTPAKQLAPLLGLLACAALPAAGQPLAPPEQSDTPGYLGAVGDTDQVNGGVEILSVRPGGPAAAAGLRPADVIVRLNGSTITDVDALSRALQGLAAGQKANMEVRRAGKLLELSATLATRPLNDGGVPPASATAFLGVTTQMVDDVAADRLGLRRGALVEAVVPQSPASDARLPIGSVIVAVDEYRIDSPADLVEAIAAARPGQVVTIKYYQGTALRGVRVALGAKPAEGPLATTPPPGPLSAAPPDVADSPPALSAPRSASPPSSPTERPLVIPPVPPVPEPAAAAAGEPSREALIREVQQMRALLEQLNQRLAALERQLAEPE